MTNEVQELLDALHEGRITLDEVAQHFRVRKWPRRRKTDPTSYLDMAAAELQDPDPYIPNSFDDVAAAFHQKKITRDQFRALSEAVAYAQRAEDADG
ncbi:MAG TPA: hypothetical protein VN695_07835 [Streptosporangiaceae bacterium]|nr:hypothetical protein [Streptosporangiaceae bacterium]